MSDDKLLADITFHYSLDKAAAKSVLDYAESLTSKDRKANDYALAKTLNERVASMIGGIAWAFQIATSAAHGIDITQLNKSYILLVHELKRIYSRNDELKNLSPDPAWESFDILEGAEWYINQYVYEHSNDSGTNHVAQINRLCVIAGVENPEISPEIKVIIDEADKAITAYDAELEEQKRKHAASNRNWFIPSYNVRYNLDGTILVNGVLKLKKVHAGSVPDKLMSQAMESPNEVFKPELGQTRRNLGTTLSSMGFSGTLRELFFPSVSKDKGILFRPLVPRTTADSERINTTELDTKLKQLGASTKQFELDIPF